MVGTWSGIHNSRTLICQLHEMLYMWQSDHYPTFYTPSLMYLDFQMSHACIHRTRKKSTWREHSPHAGLSDCYRWWEHTVMSCPTQDRSYSSALATSGDTHTAAREETPKNWQMHKWQQLVPQSTASSFFQMLCLSVLCRQSEKGREHDVPGYWECN